MARTQAADYGQRLEAIVEAAAGLFASRGFLGTSVADLSAACGMSKSLIYHYYGAKEDILYDVMRTHLEALAKASTAARDPALPPDARLRRLTHAFMTAYVGAADRHKVLLNDLDQLDPPRRADIVERQRDLIALVEEILTALLPEAARRAEQRRPLAMLYFGLINWTHIWYRPDGPLAPDAVADMAVALVLGGLPAIGRNAATPSAH
ncbi:TetR/AcrR family transcriptional regulator [Zavarzinia sp. CC-PAN008]|uniref:TetR/AcrR family transcriptional regulator n=1 Tax=Zavarzinia sp. CC-PAN008 TaxID=3243332 RepID=UPI003F74AA45